MIYKLIVVVQIKRGILVALMRAGVHASAVAARGVADIAVVIIVVVVVVVHQRFIIAFVPRRFVAAERLVDIAGIICFRFRVIYYVRAFVVQR